MATDKDVTDLFYKKLADSPFVMLGLENDAQHSAPMTAQFDSDRPHTLWFFMGNDNRLAGGGVAMAQFVAKGHDLFACIMGTLTRDDDPATIDRFWSKQVEAWFPEGRDDPSLTLMRFDPSSAEIWEADVSLAGRVKMLFGGTIKREEIGKHAEVSL